MGGIGMYKIWLELILKGDGAYEKMINIELNKMLTKKFTVLSRN